MSVKTWVGILFIVWLTGWGWGQTPPPDVTTPPQVISVMRILPDGTHSVSWTYDRTVSHALVREHLKQFEQFLQKPLQKIRVREDSLKRKPTPQDLFTVVEFATGGLVDLKKGTFWLDPFLKTFAQYDTLQVYVLLPKKMVYKGYLYFENPALQTWVETEPQLWRCFVRLRGHDPALLSVPLVRPEPQPQPVSPPERKPPSVLGWGVVLSILGATFLGIVLYLALRRVMRHFLRFTPALWHSGTLALKHPSKEEKTDGT